MPTALSCPNCPGSTISSDNEFRLVLELDDRALIIDRNQIRIGTSPACEIRLSQGPLLHSVIHHEAGVVWIEADQETADLLVNWRTCRRMALRDGDVISAAGEDITFRHSPVRTMEEDAGRIVGEITQLTAEELCDRILVEQTAVDEFDVQRLDGWQKLMSAIRDVAVEIPQGDVQNPVPTIEISDECERLLAQIREMSEVIEGRSRDLEQCESGLMAASALMQEAQDRVSQQIEELLNQMSSATESTELRASA